MQDVAKHAIDEYTNAHGRTFQMVLTQILTERADLLRRLGDA